MNRKSRWKTIVFHPIEAMNTFRCKFRDEAEITDMQTYILGKVEPLRPKVAIRTTPKVLNGKAK
jgi:hypothetical protein